MWLKRWSKEIAENSVFTHLLVCRFAAIEQKCSMLLLLPGTSSLLVVVVCVWRWPRGQSDKTAEQVAWVSRKRVNQLFGVPFLSQVIQRRISQLAQCGVEGVPKEVAIKGSEQQEEQNCLHNNGEQNEVKTHPLRDVSMEKRCWR